MSNDIFIYITMFSQKCIYTLNQKLRGFSINENSTLIITYFFILLRCILRKHGLIDTL